MMFCFRSILQIWIILIGFRDTNENVIIKLIKPKEKLGKETLYYYM